MLRTIVLNVQEQCAQCCVQLYQMLSTILWKRFSTVYFTVLMLLATVVVTFIPQMEKLVLRTTFSTFQAGLLNGKVKNIHPLRFNGRKGENYPPPPSLRSSSHLSQGDNRLARWYSVVTDSPPETGRIRPLEKWLNVILCLMRVKLPSLTSARREYPAGGRGWINSLRTLVVTKFATPSAPALNTKMNKNSALFAFFAWKTIVLIFISRKGRKGRRIPFQTTLPLE